MEKIIYVYDDFSDESSCLLGRLYIDSVKGNEIYSFEYDDNWLINNKAETFIDPDLPLYRGRQYPSDQKIFGIFSDACPDRWGRILIMKKERIQANKENRNPQKLYDSDFLLGVYDETRMGGLRFKLDPNDDFVNTESETSVPPWTTLRSLEEASRNIDLNDVSTNDEWINQLLKTGSSLGGARPKATIKDQFGDLWIAKFPSKNDISNVGAWEKVASDLGVLCGLNVPESKIETFSDLGSTFLVKRFDRKNGKRVHFASAMTLLSKRDGASASDGSSYLDIVEFIKANGASPDADLKELFKRIVFNMAVNNIDDHLRNHAFIFEKRGWRLSPVFDVNPVPYGNELSLNVSENDNTISFDLAISVSDYFKINKEEALKMVEETSIIIKNNWEKLAKKYGISKSQIEYMRPAFVK